VAALNESRIRALLADVPWVRPTVLERVGSTNDEVRRRAERGAPEGTAVIASAQEAGRGRRGRTWHSPAALGVYLSVLVRPSQPAAAATRYTLAAGLASCLAARACGAGEAVVKWPNDVLWRGRKIAGTLAEMRTPPGETPELILGTGFNVGHAAPDFPEDLRGTAGSLRLAAEAEGAPLPVPEDVAAAHLKALAALCTSLARGEWERVAAAWADAAPEAAGVLVRVAPAAGGPPYRARTCGIDGAGALVVEREDGRREALTLGESLLRGED